ncbi:uncharacterized protein EI97DRAFT_460690 [Westerdykella ornata]|uniref:Uncharacterized protein n=1 Tax=Westerdykella ornata TaxID=318751 RepID=A0A6A6JAW1_WESOR|nr:uncharacterized protein EI97DRAFT_460690 [Westerdykella ornata]KAF2273750.1 hypothetical protein EI97DRAFT_460690 [Westerdykella ornata]
MAASGDTPTPHSSIHAKRGSQDISSEGGLSTTTNQHYSPLNPKSHRARFGHKSSRAAPKEPPPRPLKRAKGADEASPTSAEEATPASVSNPSDESPPQTPKSKRRRVQGRTSS